MITHVLFIDSDSSAMTRVKDALEKAGNFEASVFTTGLAALEHAEKNPPSVVVVSLNVQDVSPDELVTGLRGLYAALPVLLRAPDDADPLLIDRLKPQGVLYGSYSTRVLVPMIEEALTADLAAPAPEQAGPDVVADDHESLLAGAPPSDDLAEFGEVLKAIEPGLQAEEQDTFKTLVESLRAPVEKPSLLKRSKSKSRWADPEAEASAAPPAEAAPPASDHLFEKLAAEEPPFPTLEDSGTVRDLISMTDPEFEQTPPGTAVDVPDEMIGGLHDQPLGVAEQELLQALADASAEPRPESRRPAVDGEASKKRTPPFVVDEVTPFRKDAATLALELTQHVVGSTAQAIILLKDNAVVTAAGSLNEQDIAVLAEAIDCRTVNSRSGTQIKFVALRTTNTNYMVVAVPTLDEMVLVLVSAENTHLGTIRQEALGLAAALRNPPQPISPKVPEPAPEPPEPGFFRETPAPEASEAFMVMAAEPDDTTDYGVTGRIQAEGEDAEPLPTEAEHVEQRVAETREAPESAPQLDPATLVKYACAWLLRDPAAELDEELIHALPVWLDQVISLQHWLPEQTEAQPDYISVVVNVPPATVPSDIVAILKQAIGQRILAARPELAASIDQLWADAYYAIAPGRPLSGEEISRFISYQRGS